MLKLLSFFSQFIFIYESKFVYFKKALTKLNFQNSKFWGPFLARQFHLRACLFGNWANWQAKKLPSPRNKGVSKFWGLCRGAAAPRPLVSCAYACRKYQKLPFFGLFARNFFVSQIIFFKLKNKTGMVKSLALMKHFAIFSAKGCCQSNNSPIFLRFSSWIICFLTNIF